MVRWGAEYESRSYSLSCTLPAQDLVPFWRSIVEKAYRLQIPTQRGENVAYFQHPRLLFQASVTRHPVPNGDIERRPSDCHLTPVHNHRLPSLIPPQCDEPTDGKPCFAAKT